MKKVTEIIKNHKIETIVLTIFCVLYVLLLSYANKGFSGYTITDSTGIEYETAKVIEVVSDNAVRDPEIENYRRGNLILKIEISSGRYKGQVVEIVDYLSALYNVDVKENDSISVRIDTVGLNKIQVSVYNYNRTGWLLLFIAIFAIALILIGGSQGFRAFVGLVFTFISVVYIVVPLTLKGYSSVMLSIGLVIVTTTLCLYLLSGLKPKTIGAALGCICGVLCAAAFGALAIKLVSISAYQSEEAEVLMLVKYENALKMRGLLLSSILLASLGAVMDVSMSISSAMEEIFNKNPKINAKELFISGMNVGRDASGTMANTLILAIAGSSFNMMILIYSYQVSFIQLMNTDFVAIELIRGIAGSLGIIMTIPFVSYITSKLLTNKKTRTI